MLAVAALVGSGRGRGRRATARRAEGGQSGSSPTLVRIDGSWRDVSSWAEKHPGGAWLLRACHGRDVTPLFHAIHWREGSSSAAVLEKLPVSGPPDGAKPYAFKAAADAPPPLAPSGQARQSDSAFARDIAAFLAEEFPTPESAKADAFHWSLVGLALALAGYCWAGWLHGDLLLAFAVPFAHWLLTGLTFHEAGHGNLSSIPAVNYAMQFTSLPIVYNPWVFWSSHIFSHHAYTNDENYDSDVHLWNPIRLCEASPVDGPAKPFLGTQGLNQFLLKSALSTLNTCVLAPGRILFDRQGGVDSVPAGVGKAQLALSLLPPLLVLVLPVLNFHDEPARMMFLMLWPWLVSGAIWTTVTQVSHIQSECQFPAQDSVDEGACWWRRQAETTLEYSQDSVLWTYLTAGLNMQGLHHVTAGQVNFCHFTRIYPKYAAICAKHGVPVHQREDVFAATQGLLSFVDRINPTDGERSPVLADAA